MKKSNIIRLRLSKMFLLILVCMLGSIPFELLGQIYLG